MTDTQRIDVAASDWTVRLHRGRLTEMQREELAQWLAADSRHRGALLRAQVIWEDVDRLAALAVGTQLGGEPPSVRGGGVSSDGIVESSPMPAAESASRTINPVFFRCALAASLVILVGAWLYAHLGAEHYSTPLGKTERVRLSDGSEVTLNTDTRIRVQVKEPERRVDLENGEALFKVAKDPTRPFVVHVGTLSIRAVGTTFSVHKAASRTEVVVTEGAVELTDQGEATETPPRLIVADQSATVVESREVVVRKQAAETIQRQLAWVDGAVRFTGESLALAVAEMNRHNRIQIVVDDPALAARPVAGTFQLEDPASFAATIAVAFDAKQFQQEGTIHLRRVD